MNVALVYLHRYLRLTPLLAVTILFSTSVLQFFGNGPLWPDVVGYFAQQCKRNWWKTLLYIQNYASPDDIVSALLTFPLEQVKFDFFFILFSSVFGTFMVFGCRHTTLFYCASYCVFHLFV